MDKNILLQMINNAITEGSEKQLSSPTPFLYKQSITMLENIKNEVISAEDPRKPQTLADSLGMFSVREVDLYDRDYSIVLCNVCEAYEEYHRIE